MKYLQILITILIFSLSAASYAQDTSWINYTDGHTIIDMASDSNILWIATTGGIVKIDQTKGISTYFTQSNSGLKTYSFNSIAVDKKHNLWIGTDGKGLYKYDGSSWIKNPNSVNLPTQYISDIEVDHNGNIWIGCKFWLEYT